MSAQPPNSTTSTLSNFLQSAPGFSTLSHTTLEQIAAQLQPLRYPIGRAILTSQTLPTQISIIYQGQVRIIGYDPRTTTPVTLQRLESSESIGWLGLLRNRPSETAIASTETVCLTISAASFQKLIEQEPSFAQHYHQQASILEVFEILGQQLLAKADGSTDLKILTQDQWREAKAQTLPPKTKASQLSPELNWYISSSTIATEQGKPVATPDDQPISRSSAPIRLIGLPAPVAIAVPESNALSVLEPTWAEIPEAPEQPPSAQLYTDKPVKYPFVSGNGDIDGPLACFGMLAKYFNLPLRRDVIRRILITQSQRSESLSLPIHGAIAETMGLRAQLVEASSAILGYGNDVSNKVSHLLKGL